MRKEDNNNGNGTRASSNRNEVSIGILGEKMTNIEKSLDKLETTVKDLVKKIDETYTTRQEFLVTKEDVQDLQGNMKWIVRLVIGAVVIAVIGLVVSTNIIK